MFWVVSKTVFLLSGIQLLRNTDLLRPCVYIPRAPGTGILMSAFSLTVSWTLEGLFPLSGTTILWDLHATTGYGTNISTSRTPTFATMISLSAHSQRDCCLNENGTAYPVYLVHLRAFPPRIKKKQLRDQRNVELTFLFNKRQRHVLFILVSFAIMILETKFLCVQNGMLFYCTLQSTPLALFVIQSWDWKG